VGFPDGCLNWVIALLSSAITRVVMNGVPGQPICHGHGLHQGDLLSPMLFLLIMEVLDSLIRNADTWKLLHDLQVSAIPFRTSLYADDLIVFVRPKEQDIWVIRDIFLVFACASGLACNPSKS
jgi:hypothetical protein